jgi:hypothetical protein
MQFIAGMASTGQAGYAEQREMVVVQLSRQETLGQELDRIDAGVAAARCSLDRAGLYGDAARQVPFNESRIHPRVPLASVSEKTRI